MTEDAAKALAGEAWDALHAAAPGMRKISREGFIERSWRFYLPAATPASDGGADWKCAARAQGSAGGNEPTDCDWPVCGCDPYADKVIAALDERGQPATSQPSPPPTGSERETVIEECAKVADAAMLVGDGCADPRTWDNGYNNACHNIAKRIRALASNPTGSEQ